MSDTESIITVRLGHNWRLVIPSMIKQDISEWNVGDKLKLRYFKRDGKTVIELTKKEDS